MYEDSLNLLGKLPGIAATIYNNTYKGGKQIPMDPSLDWAANLAVMMGQDKNSVASLDMMRMYQTIHAGMHPQLPLRAFSGRLYTAVRKTGVNSFRSTYAWSCLVYVCRP